VFLKIYGETYYLWRAVDQEGTVLDVLVQSRRNAAAAKRLMRKLMKKMVSAHKGWDKLAGVRCSPRGGRSCLW